MNPQHWTVPRCFEGRTVAVLASGPSMSQAIADQLRISGLPCIVVNSTYRLAPWAWMLYAADVEWWQHPSNADAHRFQGLRVSCQGVKGVHLLRYAGAEGYSPEPDCVHSLGLSGAQALQIAVKSGAARVLLLGMDMHGGHWHGDHPAGLRNTDHDAYAMFVRRIERAAPLIMAGGADIVNCTPGSALKCFRASTLDAELEKLGLAWHGL